MKKLMVLCILCGACSGCEVFEVLEKESQKSTAKVYYYPGGQIRDFTQEDDTPQKTATRAAVSIGADALRSIK